MLKSQVTEEHRHFQTKFFTLPNQIAFVQVTNNNTFRD